MSRFYCLIQSLCLSLFILLVLLIYLDHCAILNYLSHFFCFFIISSLKKKKVIYITPASQMNICTLSHYSLLCPNHIMLFQSEKEGLFNKWIWKNYPLTNLCGLDPFCLSKYALLSSLSFSYIVLSAL